MGSSLRDIPGAGGGRRRRGLGSVTPGPAARPWQPPVRPPSRGRGRRDGLRFQGPRLQVDRFNLVLGLAFVALFVVGLVWLIGINRVSVSSRGMEDGGGVTSQGLAELRIGIVVEPSSRLGSASVRFQDEDVTGELVEEDGALVWAPPVEGLEEGDYELDVDVPRAVMGTESWTLHFAVDDTPPVVEADPPAAVGLGEPLTITGTVDERVDLTADERPVEVDEDGAFEVTFDTAPAGAVDLLATDPAGNQTALPVPVAVEPPRSHAVHLGSAWGDDGVRDAALALLDEGTIDTVVLDVKDECGVVTHGSDVELARQVGAVDERYDLGGAIDEVHEAGGQVVVRLVAFRDPLLSRWAWANGHPDWVLRDTADDPWPEYGDGEGCPEATNAPPIGGGFANVASRAVWDYNLALATEAAALGADQVLLDDVRRPGGDLTFMQAEGLLGTYVETLTAFLAEAREAVRAEGAYLGATLAGLSVTDASTYDQDTAAMAPVVDFLAPEVYPESYSSGFFNVADPVAAPGATVEGAVSTVAERRGEATTPIVPWLQDYSSGAVTYGTAEAQAQIDAAAAAGSCSWVLRDPELTYSTGLTPGC